ncbi:MAG: hypothetical protein K0Q87_4072 [Neobacillus sp.]|jgi:hypothetical protein|nr:hypothetical protein [Neobacillus sp.]
MHFSLHVLKMDFYDFLWFLDKCVIQIVNIRQLPIYKKDFHVLSMAKKSVWQYLGNLAPVDFHGRCADSCGKSKSRETPQERSDEEAPGLPAESGAPGMEINRPWRIVLSFSYNHISLGKKILPMHDKKGSQFASPCYIILLVGILLLHN